MDEEIAVWFRQQLEKYKDDPEFLREHVLLLKGEYDEQEKRIEGLRKLSGKAIGYLQRIAELKKQLAEATEMMAEAALHESDLKQAMSTEIKRLREALEVKNDKQTNQMGRGYGL